MNKSSKKKKEKIFKKGLGTRGIGLVLLRPLTKKKQKISSIKFFQIPSKIQDFQIFQKKKKNQNFQFLRKIQVFEIQKKKNLH